MFQSGGGGLCVGTGSGPSHDLLSPPLPNQWKNHRERERERRSLRSRGLRHWIIPGAFPGPIEEGAPLDLSVVTAAVSGQNGP